MNKFLVTLAVTLTFCGVAIAQSPKHGMRWPEGQVFPQFAQPAGKLDALFFDDKALEPGEVVMLTTLQGIVNKEKPRIYFLSHRRHGKAEWAYRLGLKLREYPATQPYQLVKKYRSEVKGAVLYSTEKSRHYTNLATTVSGIMDAVAVTPAEMKKLKAEGIELKVLADLTELPYTETVDIYSYLFNTYWKDCTRRTLISLNPDVYGDLRDMAVACNAAVVWLDPREADERAVLEPFLADLIPGQTVMLGWWHEERAGIGIGSKYGISTIPADYFNNGTVYGGYEHKVTPAVIPQRKPLENKVYIALFLSDGDNIQYCEHTLVRLWNNDKRGTFPINWTLSPSLVDTAPCMLNYFYSTSTANDCLVSGPSGMGYAMFYDGLNHLYYSDKGEVIEPYSKLSNTYFTRAGIKVVTIWDTLSEEQLDVYAQNARYLYGATMEDWGFEAPVMKAEREGRLAFLPNKPCYAGRIEDMVHHWKDRLLAYDGKEPMFLTAQGESWKMGQEQMAELTSVLDKFAPGKIELCRADHFFSYYNEANGLDFNILLKEEVSATKSAQSIVFDLGAEWNVDRYAVRDESSKLIVELSLDGKTWNKVEGAAAACEILDVDFPSTKARYARFTGKGLKPENIELFGRR